MPSAARNFFGRVVDRLLPGQNYNSQTGAYTHIGAGIVGAGLRAGASFFGGPLGGIVAGRLINKYLAGQQGPSASGPYAGGYQFSQQPQAGTTSGLPDTQTSYGAWLPNYGQAAPNVGMNLGLGGSMGPSAYGPYSGGYQFQGLPPAPTTSGLPDTQTSYGVSLPNYGPPASGLPSAPDVYGFGPMMPDMSGGLNGSGVKAFALSGRQMRD